MLSWLPVAEPDSDLNLWPDFLKIQIGHFKSKSVVKVRMLNYITYSQSDLDFGSEHFCWKNPPKLDKLMIKKIMLLLLRVWTEGETASHGAQTA